MQAIVGGSNLVFHPDFMLIMSNMDFLSPTSRCHSFDHRANGYARGDGISVVILKRLSIALQDNDTIRAVIRATALNQDGRTPGGITQPSGDAQQTLIRETFERTRLDMAPVRFFEAHGTGTVIGDPTEARAIGSVFREHGHRSPESPLFVGAVKSNIGHLEGGSGLAGVIKTVMILERGVIVPNAEVERVNPRIDTQGLCIKVSGLYFSVPTEGRISI
jgi:acyl transferase domain-containing protein